MAWVERLVTRTTQPQDAVGVDWNNPLTLGLVSALMPNSSNYRDSVTQSAYLSTGATASASKLGRVVDLNGSAYVNLGKQSLSDVNLFADASSKWTAVICARANVAGSTGTFLAKAGGSFATRTFQIFQSGSGVQTPTINLRGGAGGVATDTNWGFSDANYHQYAVSWDGTTAYGYGDTTRKSVIGVGTAAQESENIVIGARTGGTGALLTGQTSYAYFWNRALSDAEIKSLSENPWQIFEPEVQRVWVDDFVSAGGGVTGTLNANESGSDTGSLSGQVVTQGTLSAAELTGDTAAMAGGVIVQGALSATEAGSDTASISGASVATGTLNASEAGSDTASLAGVVIVQGAASASETGSDTLASTGLVLVKGALSVSETGSDTAVINGSSVITTTGDINASESGADSAAMTGAVLVQALINAVETGGDTAQLAGQIIVTGVLGAAEVGSDTALIYSTAPVLVIAGAQTRPSRMQTGDRPTQLQSSERASRLQSSTRHRR